MKPLPTFYGCIPALMTPCNKSGTPNFDALTRKGRELIEEGMSLQEILRKDPGAEVFPSSPFDAGFGIPASHTFVDRAYVSMKKN